MQGYLYILKNTLTNRYYIGSTIDLKRRLTQHKNGSTRTTKLLETDTLVNTEILNTIEEASLREKK